MAPERVKMRNALISGLLIIFFSSLDYTGCASNYINLRQPIYLVIDESFWSECDFDPDTYEACRESRLQQLNEGADDWFKHFDEAARPKMVIVYSQADLPSNPVNNPIYIKIQPGFCPITTGNKDAVACYTDKPAIIFDLPEYIALDLVAHELGHAFGREGKKHNDMPKNTYSVMSYTLRSDHVIPTDIKILCETHSECPPHEDTWCQGEFWDKCRCPSASYEDGEKIRKMYTPDCY